jgi:hypothetical protein
VAFRNSSRVRESLRTRCSDQEVQMNCRGWLVDVAGIEPATPCLQMRFENAMWLFFLVFTYVVVHRF